MAVLEPGGVAVPQQRVKAIQFGLPTTKEILAASVFEKRQSIERPRELLDARLGLPAPGDRCTSCGAASLEQCDGHFGHITLPTPIYHPSHVSSICKLLQKICLSCCRLKKKPNVKDNPVEEEQKVCEAFDDLKFRVWENGDDEASKPQVKKNPVSGKIPPSTPEGLGKNSRCRKIVVARNAGAQTDGAASLGKSTSRALQSTNKEATVKVKKEHVDMSGYVILSDDEGNTDEDDAANITKRIQKHSSKRSPNLTIAPYPVIDLESDHEDELKMSAGIAQAGQSHIAGADPTFPGKSGHMGSSKIHECSSTEQQSKGKAKDKNCSNAQLQTQRIASNCKYCTRRYPVLKLKVVAKLIRNDECIQGIQMEIASKGEEIPQDFWSFLGDHYKSLGEEKSGVRYLLPMEALHILRKIPQESFKRLGMDSVVARPEALILECIPVPPNCIRLSENMVHYSSLSSRVGTDLETQLLRRLLKIIASIKGARIGKPTYRASLTEYEQLQYVFSQYLRAKGAPKVADNVEPTLLRSSFMPSKSYSSKWLNQLRGTVLGKSSNFSARNILTGDPCIEIDEIAIPWELAENITIPEKVTVRNKEDLQKYVDNAPVGIPTSCPLIIEQGGRAFDISMSKKRRLLEIGDSVHRRLQDGDRVFANRPPTLDRHALICLRVKVHTNNSFAINPILCAPYNADFDGDALHLYIPQSIEARLETCELMALERQFTCSQGGQAIISLTQEALLSAYILTVGHTFFKRTEIGQMLVWESFRNEIPAPAILKSPKGPFWTGKQIFSMTLPPGLSYSSSDLTGVLIKDGELLKSDESSLWLKNNPDSLVCAISQHAGPSGALKHLNLANQISQELFFLRGFSVGPFDFSLGVDLESRASIVREAIRTAKYEICEQCKLHTRNVQRDPTCEKEFVNFAVKILHEHFSKVENRLLDLMSWQNSLYTVLKSGSKGSAAKLRQQVGCVGMQLLRGNHLIDLNQRRKASLSQGVLKSLISRKSGMDLEVPGLIESSYLDGLRPDEFFYSSISSRESSIKQGIDIRQPGTLFKNLMLFLRDISSSYDGTVRYSYNQHIVQFKYGGSRAHGRFELQKTKNGCIQRYKMEEDAHLRWRDSIMAGDAVGVLAATAIVQPAYQMLLDPPQQTDLKRSSPLEILQDSLLSRHSSSLKNIDRTVILRVNKCHEQRTHWREWNAIKVQKHLQKVTLEMLTRCVLIQFTGELNEDESGKSPLVCHLQLKEDALTCCQISTGSIISCLIKTVHEQKIAFKGGLSLQPTITCRDSCHLKLPSNPARTGPCIHISYDKYECLGEGKDSLLSELLISIRDQLVPNIMTTTIKGMSWVKSVDVVWEEKDDPSRLASGKETRRKGELVVVAVIDEAYAKKRGSAWNAVIMACMPIIHLLDLRRSTPAGIQEIRHVLGIEAANQAILKRIVLALKTMGNPIHHSHLKLIADLMVHSGEVIGFTAGGLKEFSQKISMSAPFLQGSFQAPFKTFLSAAARGQHDSLHGIVPSSVWGKSAPVGTGGPFDLLWYSDQIPEDLGSDCVKKLDIFEVVACFRAEMEESKIQNTDETFIVEEYQPNISGHPESMDCFSPPQAIPDSEILREGEIEWGKKVSSKSPPPRDSDDGWGHKVVPDKANEEDDGWGRNVIPDRTTNGWDRNVIPDKANEEDDGWGGNVIPDQTTNGWGHNVMQDERTHKDDGWGRTVIPAEISKEGGDSGWGCQEGPYSSTLTTGDMGWGQRTEVGPSNILMTSDIGWGQRSEEGGSPNDNNIPERINVGDDHSKWGCVEGRDSSAPVASDSRWVETAVTDSSRPDRRKVFAPTGANAVPLQRRPAKEHPTMTAANAAERVTVLANDSRIVDSFVKTVRNILHYRYEPGQNLLEDDAKFVLEQLLLYHPDYNLKLGSGADAIKVDFNPSYPTTRCFFVVRKDGTCADFSYHKCVRGYLEKNFPTYLEEYESLYRTRKNEEEVSEKPEPKEG